MVTIQSTGDETRTLQISRLGTMERLGEAKGCIPSRWWEDKG